MKRDKSENALPLTRILAKWRQNPRRKGRASLQVLLPQEVYCSRHCANMQTVSRQCKKDRATLKTDIKNVNLRLKKG